MGSRLQVKPEEFAAIAINSKNLVVMSPPNFWRKTNAQYEYVVRDGDFYYYTNSKKPLQLTPTCKIKEVEFII